MKKLSTFVKTLTLMAVLITVPVTSSIHAGTTAAKPALTAGNAPVMTQMTPEQIEAAVEEYFDAIGAFDVPRYVNTFAPNGVLEDPVGTPPVQGTAAISAYITNIIAPFQELKHKIQDINVCGHEAAVNWKIQLKTTTGKKITIDGMGVFNFDQNGKLQSVREFWDLQAFLDDLQN